MQILILHGVNLNMFGQRDPAHYGTATLYDIDQALAELAAILEASVECFHTNHEGQMIDRIHAALHDGTQGVVINAGAWSHYSYALRDAVAMLKVPVVEVHMSNIHAREAFRQHSVFSGVVMAQISGLGIDSYLSGLRAVVNAASAAAPPPMPQ